MTLTGTVKGSGKLDINDLRGVATIFAMLGFLGVCVWAYSSKRKQRFDEAANLPFADETDSDRGDNNPLK